MLLQHPREGMTIPDVAKQIGVDEQTVRHWIRSGKLPATRWGPEGAKVIRVDPADLEGLGARPAGPAALVLHCQRERETANTVQFGEVSDVDQALAGLRLTRAALAQLGDPAELTVTVRAGRPTRPRGRPPKPRPKNE